MKALEGPLTRARKFESKAVAVGTVTEKMYMQTTIHQKMKRPPKIIGKTGKMYIDFMSPTASLPILITSIAMLIWLRRNSAMSRQMAPTASAVMPSAYMALMLVSEVVVRSAVWAIRMSE